MFLDFNDKSCVEILLSENVLAFPTETVYGLGVIYDSFLAFNRLVEIKNRKPDKPFTVMVSSIKEVEKFAYIDEKISRVIEKFFPGEITLLLKSKDVYPWVNLGSDTIGIRMSALKNVCMLIEKVGKPLLVTSANISGSNPINEANEVNRIFKDKLKGIVKVDDISTSNTPSTIVMIKDDEIKLIRKGSIPFDDIKKTWEGLL